MSSLNIYRLNRKFRVFSKITAKIFQENAASLIAQMKKELFDEVESRFESQLVDLRNQMLNEKRDYAESLLDLYRYRFNQKMSHVTHVTRLTTTCH